MKNKNKCLNEECNFFSTRQNFEDKFYLSKEHKFFKCILSNIEIKYIRNCYKFLLFQDRKYFSIAKNEQELYYL